MVIYTGMSACCYGLFRRKHQLFIFTGLHGPAPRGQPLAEISLIEPGQQQDQQDADDPNNEAPPINRLSNVLSKAIPGLGEGSNYKKGGANRSRPPAYSHWPS